MDEDRIINKLMEMDEKLDNMLHKGEFYDFKKEITQQLDNQLVILKRLDEERVFTIEWIRRVEADVKMLKEHLNLA